MLARDHKVYTKTLGPKSSDTSYYHAYITATADQLYLHRFAVGGTIIVSSRVFFLV